jgi:Rps23 Pro-64 3,4-dihydroxylase Tpa1-like proline 4-hydroxylase
MCRANVSWAAYKLTPLLDFNGAFCRYTCILYLNDNDWDMEQDGGALRLYPNMKDVHVLGAAVGLAANNFVDIAPINGRLLVFDSRLVHSVQPVTSTTKRRRALTLWINKPNNSDVRGEGITSAASSAASKQKA